MRSSDCTDFIHGVTFSQFASKNGSLSGVFLVILLLLSVAELAAGQPGQPDSRNGDTYNYGRLSPAMAVIVVVLIAALFFMGFFSIYIRHCTGSRADASVQPAGGARDRRATAARGLDASIIETFPTFVYAEVKAQKIGKGALECAVCLNEFQDDETLRLLPRCDHVFHPHCIGAWLQAHVTCPVCRANLAEQPGQTDPVQSDEPDRAETDVEAQNGIPEPVSLEPGVEPGSRPDLPRVKFPRSHTTGHSLVQPGRDTQRFTLRLPDEVRKRLMANWKLNRSNSLLVLPRGGSSRRGKTVDRLRSRSDRWLFLKTPSFLWRNSSVQSAKVPGNGDREGGSVKLGGSIKIDGVPGSTGDSVRSDRWSFLRNPSFLWRNSSVHSPRVGANKDGEGTSAQPIGPVGSTSDSVRLPV